MKNLLAAFALTLASLSCHASMIWQAVAVDAAQFERLKKDPDALMESLDAKGEQIVSLDKDWHGLHFLLTGSAWSTRGTAAQAIMGGREFGEDMGYGPARALSVSQVKAVAKELAKTSPAALSARFDPKAMTKAEIYPAIIWEREGQEALAGLLRSYESLASFYRRAAEKGQMVIIVMT
jgi:hypothetical protein